MDLVTQGIVEALRLLTSGDAEVFAVTWLSIRIACGSTLISLLIGVPLGVAVAFRRLPAWRIWLAFVNAGMGLPPVVAGLIVTLALWRTGPLGDLRLLFTPWAMVIAQVLIALPVVAGLTYSAMQQLDPHLYEQALVEGANDLTAGWVLVAQARPAILAMVVAAFGSVISEVGASMMVGGNIRGQTRVLTTATVLETGKGNFEIAIALSVILLSLTFAINFILTRIQQREQRRWPKPS